MQGIYQISNNSTGRFYIGSSLCIPQRFTKHKGDLRANRHKNSYLQSAWNKYGERDFTFDVVEELPNVTEQRLRQVEQIYLNNSDCMWSKGGYNLCPKAQDTEYHLRNRGRSRTEETKHKLRVANLGKRASEETKAMMAASRRGRIPPNLGKTASDATRRKMSQARKDKVLGPLSDETKTKMSLAKKGKIPTGSCGRIAVEQLSKSGKVLKVWMSMKEAADCVGVSKDAISNAVKRNGKSAGFFWKKV